jgi:hypothetical protein
MNQRELKQPFFALFLESQHQNGQNSFTLPTRDTVTAPSKDNLETHKYPSDNDEEGEPI